MAFIHSVCDEWVAEHPEDVERVCGFVDLANLELFNGRLDTTAVLINIVNFTLGIHFHFGNDELLIYVIVLLVIFSPHRFLAHAHLLAEVTPLHARLIEFLRQYLEGTYLREQTHVPSSEQTSDKINTNANMKYLNSGGPTCASQRLVAVAEQNVPASSSLEHQSNAFAEQLQWRVCTRPPAVSTITPDFERSTMIGYYLPGLAALSSEQREQLRSKIIALRIHDQLDGAMLRKFGLGGAQISSSTRAPCSHASRCTSATGCGTHCGLEADWRWKFVFLLAALNDPRMSEVSLRDHEVRWAISEQYTPLINELLVASPSILASKESDTPSLSAV